MKEKLQVVAMFVAFICAALIGFEFICGLIMGYDGPLGELNKFLKAELRWRRRPLIYITRINTVTGVVMAKDYHRKLRQEWRRSAGATDPRSRVVVSPTFRFTDDPYMATGDSEDFQKLIAN